MRIEIQKPVCDYPKQKWDFFLMLLQTPALLICVVIFLLLLACESYYLNQTANESGTTFIGGGFSLCGFILLCVVLINTYKKRKEQKSHMAPATGHYYVILSDDGYERGIKDFWSENKNWRLLTGFDERHNAFWPRFGQAEFPIFKYEFKQAADIDEFGKFLKKKISRG